MMDYNSQQRSVAVDGFLSENWPFQASHMPSEKRKIAQNPQKIPHLVLFFVVSNNRTRLSSHKKRCVHNDMYCHFDIW